MVFFKWHVLSKNKIGSELRVSVRINSVLGCTEICKNQSQKRFKKINRGTMTSKF